MTHWRHCVRSRTDHSASISGHSGVGKEIGDEIYRVRREKILRLLPKLTLQSGGALIADEDRPYSEQNAD